MSYKPRSNCLKFISAALFMLLLQSVSGQHLSNVDGLVDRNKKMFGNQVVVMAWRDTVIYQKQTGDYTLNTQENIGAASAWLTAALVMTFVDQGKISLDDPVSNYLPIFSKYAMSYLTIRHCLANTVGMEPEKGGLEKLFQKTKFASLEDQVNAFVSKREIQNNPGEAFDYNNMGTIIAGRVLEIVGKKSFDRLATERIFRPLGMKKTTFTSETAVNPFSGAQSTPADYLKFLAMLLNNGVLNGKKVLSTESVAEMLKTHIGAAKVLFVPKQAEGFTYALGSWIQGNGIYGAPAFTGGWYYIDTTKRYACVIFGKTKEKDEKKESYMQIIREFEAAL